MRKQDLIMKSLFQKYNEDIVKELQKELNVKNPMAVPKLQKIVVNVGLGEALSNKKVIQTASDQLKAITGQKPKETRAKKAIATFKLQAGDICGLKVTLRSRRMYDFLDKIIKVVFPRIRDFRGVGNFFDGRGNFTIGFAEQIVFPEIEYSKIDKIRGLEVTLVTTGKNTKETKLLLEKLGMPFVKEQARGNKAGK